MVALSLDHVYFSRDHTPILQDMHFCLDKPGIVGLLGKNGAGKSTTIHLLMGYLAPDRGQASVLGEPSTALSLATRQRVGILYEGFIQYNFMRIREVEAFYRGIHGARWHAEVFWDLVNRMHVPHERKLTQLSCGQRSQVTLGVLLAQQPDVLILDDFSLGLDVGYRRLFLDYLKHYVARHPMTVLLTSHVVSELEDVLDEVLVIKKGKLLGQWTPREMVSRWHAYQSELSPCLEALPAEIPGIENVEWGMESVTFFTELEREAFERTLQAAGLEDVPSFQELELSFEDAFLGMTGLY